MQARETGKTGVYMTWLETMKQSQLLHGMGKTGFYRTCFKLQEAHL
jgi:hypothetical protein